MTPTIWLLAIGSTLVTVGYAGLCYEKPFGRCFVCRITPADHACRRCRGTTYRPRIAWQIWNWITSQRHNANAGEHRTPWGGGDR